MGSASAAVHHGIPQVESRDWVEIPVAFAVAAAVTYLAIAGFRIASSPQPPVDLDVHQSGAQLRITWNRDVTTRGAILDVIDGGQHTAIYVPPKLGSVTYRAWTADVEVRLAPNGSDSRLEIARCLVREPESVKVLDQELKAVQSDAAALRTDLRRHAWRIERLQRAANRLLANVPAARVKPATWWR